MLKQRLKFWLPILILAALTAAVSAPVYIQRILTPTENDFGTHIIFTLRLLKHDLPPTFVLAHPLLELILGFIYWAGRGHIGLWETGVLVQVLAQMAASLLIYLWIGPLKDRWGEVKRVFWSLTLTLVGPIILLAPLDGRFYFGYIGLANYHNPTVHLLRPFALASFYFAVRVFGSKKSPAWMIALAAALMISGALVKPNYAMSILPAEAVLAAWFLWRRRPLDWKMLLWGQWVPAVLIMAAQTVVIFLLPDADKAGITIAPFQVEQGFSHYLAAKFLLSVLFPLTLWILISLRAHGTLHPPSHLPMGLKGGQAPEEPTPALEGGGRRWVKGACLPLNSMGKGVGLLLAYLAFLMGTLQLYLLAETGIRFSDGNFRWSAQITLFLLFVAGARWLLREGSALPRWQRYLLYAAYGLHLAGGIAYYIYVFTSPHYG